MEGHLQLQSSVQLFDVAFSIKKFSFCGALFKRILAWKRDISKSFQKVILRMKLFFSLQSFTCDIRSENVFTRVVIKSKIFHSCRTCVVCVVIVSHSCYQCSTRVALVLHSCPTRVASVARVWHSCCKLDQIDLIDSLFFI